MFIQFFSPHSAVLFLYLEIQILKFLVSRCVLSHPDAVALEEWISTKDFSTDERLIPKWHIPCDEEVHFANELLDIHFKSALDDLLKICQTKIHADQGVTNTLGLKQFMLYPVILLAR